MHNDRDGAQTRHETGQRLKDLAEKCDGAGEHDLAKRMRKTSEQFASDESNKGTFSWSPFTPLKDNQMWRRALSIAMGIAFVVWAIVSIYIGHITVTHQNFTYHATSEPFVFWLVVACIFSLGIGCVYRGIRGKKSP
jgi:hypothetical protein